MPAENCVLTRISKVNPEEPTLQAVLQQLTTDGLLESDAEAKIRAGQSPGTDEDAGPWYIRALLGVSAWIAALLLLVFAITTGLASDAGEFIRLGVFLIATATIIRWLTSRPFLVQFVLAFSLAGQIMAIYGLSDQTDASTAAAVTALLEIVLVVAYPDRLHRFLCTLIAVGAALVLDSELGMPVPVSAFITLLAAAATFLWVNEAKIMARRSWRLWRPLAYGLAVALLGLLVLSFLPDGAAELDLSDSPGAAWTTTTLLLIFVLLYVEWRILGFHGVARLGGAGVLVLGGTLFILGPLIQAPGIVAAALVLALGFHRGNRALTGLALLAIALYVIAFYYNLDMTLLAKSAMLAGSGAVLLALRFVVVKQFGQLQTGETDAE